MVGAVVTWAILLAGRSAAAPKEATPQVAGSYTPERCCSPRPTVAVAIEVPMRTFFYCQHKRRLPSNRQTQPIDQTILEAGQTDVAPQKVRVMVCVEV